MKSAKSSLFAREVRASAWMSIVPKCSPILSFISFDRRSNVAAPWRYRLLALADHFLPSTCHIRCDQEEVPRSGSGRCGRSSKLGVFVFERYDCSIILSEVVRSLYYIGALTRRCGQERPVLSGGCISSVRRIMSERLIQGERLAFRERLVFRETHLGGETHLVGVTGYTR
jgi:hypothetical protein